MSNATHIAVANTIRSQIGRKALYMIGAKNEVALNEGCGGYSFRTGRVAAGKANHVKIVLNGMDTYDVTCSKIWGTNVKVIKKVEGAYVDNLHDIIEDATGLYTSL
jgi:hypothetical protein